MPRLKKNSVSVSAKNKAEVSATRIDNPIDLVAWLSETEEIKVKENGQETKKTVLKNVPNQKVLDMIKDGVQAKDKDGKVTSIRSEHYTLTIEVAKRKVPANKDGKLYEMEYPQLTPNTVEAAVLLVNGNLDTAIDKDGKEEDKPSVVRYFRQGYNMVARNAAGASISAKIEGPDKAFANAVKALQKAKGWSLEKATERAKLMFED